MSRYTDKTNAKVEDVLQGPNITNRKDLDSPVVGKNSGNNTDIMKADPTHRITGDQTFNADGHITRNGAAEYHDDYNYPEVCNLQGKSRCAYDLPHGSSNIAMSNWSAMMIGNFLSQVPMWIVTSIPKPILTSYMNRNLIWKK